MGPLAFVNWKSVNSLFTTIMWLVAVVLAVIVLTAGVASSAQPQRPARTVVRR